MRRPIGRARLGAFAALTGAAGLLTVLAGCGIEFNGGQDNLVAGKQQFVAKCGACHVLNRAATKGNVGPNLDDAFTRALQDGFKRSTVQGMVKEQIAYPNPRGIQSGPTPNNGRPAPRTVMPAKLVTGKQAENVAAYVAYAVSRPGKDSGPLATAVQQAGGGTPIAARNGTIDIAADPSGQLAYVTKQATSPPGKLSLTSTNKSSTPHDIAIQGPGVSLAKGPVVSNGGVSKVPPVTLKPGKYIYFCTVPGHRQAGMQGSLTVK
jgi:mono/diheme cytochrome c family protein